MTKNINTVNVDQRPVTLAEKTYIIPILKGLGVTLRHFLRNLFGRKDVATIEYPEVKRQYSERLRGLHILTTRDDGALRCVACFMCETACPADCIHIEAVEDPASPVEWEKKPAVFEIDLLRCDTQYSLFLSDESFFHHIDGDTHRSLGSSFAITGLEHPELSIFYGKLHILHVTVVSFQTSGDFFKFTIGLGHLFF